MATVKKLRCAIFAARRWFFIFIRKTIRRVAPRRRTAFVIRGKECAQAKIFGVSIDSARSHRKFIDKYNLPFPILSDPEKEIVNRYGVWVEKSMYGKKYMGTERSTFVIDGAGLIASIFRKVKPEEHVGLVRDALNKLAAK